MCERKLLLGWAALVLAAPVFAQSGALKSDGPRGQYRGPYDEVLFASGGTLGGGLGHAGGDPTVAAEGYNRWEFWFEIHKDVLLRAGGLGKRPVITARPAGAERAAGQRVDSGDVRREILPILSIISREASGDDLRATALLALGRLGTPEAMMALEAALKNGRSKDRPYVVLALGMIPHPRAKIELLRIYGSVEEPAEVRANAAVAMGMQGSREMIRALLADLEQRLSTASAIGKNKLIAQAALTALGMGELESRRLSVPFLVRAYGQLSARKTRSRELLVTALSSLGKLRDPAGLPTVLRALEDSDLEIQRAATLACAELGSAQAVKPLAELIDGGGDQQIKGFACIALGRIGGQAALGLLRELVQSRKSRTVQSFAALGLGLARDKDSVKILRKLLDMKSEEDLRGSFAIALGMLQDQQSAEKLWSILHRRGADPDLRGYAAIALGLIRPDGGVPRMLKFLKKDRERHEGVMRGVLLALGLWRDPAATGALLEVLGSDKRDVVRGTAVQAFNMIRDRQAIQPIVELALARGRRLPEGTRRFATAALGGLGELNNYPLYASAFYAANYRMRIPMLDDLMQYL